MTKTIKIEFYTDERDFIIDLLEYALLNDLTNKLNKHDIKKLKKHYDKGELSVKEICKLFNITKPTLYRYLKNEAKSQTKAIL